MSPRDPGTEGVEPTDERLSALLDGELAATDEATLRAEIAASPALAARLEELRAVDTALRALPEPAVAPQALERLRERIASGSEGDRAGRARGAATRAPRPRRRIVPALLAAVAAAVLALLVLPRLRGAPEPDATELVKRPGFEAPVPEPTLVPDPPPEGAPEAVPAPPPAEELALALAVESEDDYEVLEMLDWLEALGEIESS